MLFFRPYDLRVVSRSAAGTEYYTFSPTTVIHMQDGFCVELRTLAEWYRESVLWGAMRSIPFFRDFLLRKTFKRWINFSLNVLLTFEFLIIQTFIQAVIYLTSFSDGTEMYTRLLSNAGLTAFHLSCWQQCPSSGMPYYIYPGFCPPRHVKSEIEIKMCCYKYSHFVYLKPFIFPRLLEELKQVSWLPQDDLKTYTLLDFQSALLEKNQTAQVSLHSFLHCRAAILDMVWISHFTILHFLMPFKTSRTFFLSWNAKGVT